jgi:hypothetical protein
MSGRGERGRRSGRHSRDKYDPQKARDSRNAPRDSAGRGGSQAPGKNSLDGRKNLYANSLDGRNLLPGGRDRNPRYGKNDGVLYDKLRWAPPKYNTDPLPSPDCAFCGKPITDIYSALTDKQTGEPVHFDCVVAKLSEYESLDQGDVISYIGGGRFGVVHFSDPASPGTPGIPGEVPGKKFTIKKIVEWEETEHRADWRNTIADHYSIT